MDYNHYISQNTEYMILRALEADKMYKDGTAKRI